MAGGQRQTINVHGVVVALCVGCVSVEHSGERRRVSVHGVVVSVCVACISVEHSARLVTASKS